MCIRDSVDGLGTVENIEKLEKSWLLSIKWKKNNLSNSIKLKNIFYQPFSLSHSEEI